MGACVVFSHMLLVGQFSSFSTNTSCLSLAPLSIPILPAAESRMELEASFSEALRFIFTSLQIRNHKLSVPASTSALSPGSQRQFYQDISTTLISNI